MLCARVPRTQSGTLPNVVNSARCSGCLAESPQGRAWRGGFETREIGWDHVQGKGLELLVDKLCPFNRCLWRACLTMVGTFRIPGAISRHRRTRLDAAVSFHPLDKPLQSEAGIGKAPDHKCVRRDVLLWRDQELPMLKPVGDFGLPIFDPGQKTAAPTVLGKPVADNAAAGKRVSRRLEKAWRHLSY